MPKRRRLGPGSQRSQAGGRSVADYPAPREQHERSLPALTCRSRPGALSFESTGPFTGGEVGIEDVLPECRAQSAAALATRPRVVVVRCQHPRFCLWRNTNDRRRRRQRDCELRRDCDFARNQRLARQPPRSTPSGPRQRSSPIRQLLGRIRRSCSSIAQPLHTRRRERDRFGLDGWSVRAECRGARQRERRPQSAAKVLCAKLR